MNETRSQLHMPTALVALAIFVVGLGTLPELAAAPPPPPAAFPTVVAAIGDDQAVNEDDDWFASDIEMPSSHPGSAWRIWICIDEGATGRVVERIFSDGTVAQLNGGTALTPGAEYGFVVSAISSATWNLRAAGGSTTVDLAVVQRVEEGQ